MAVLRRIWLVLAFCLEMSGGAPVQDEETLWPALASGVQLYAWSPDGTQLAYGSAQHGPSSDLYVYNTLDGSTLRLPLVAAG